MNLIETRTNKVVARVIEDPKTNELELEVVDTENYELKEGSVYKKGESLQAAFILGDEIVYKNGEYDCVKAD